MTFDEIRVALMARAMVFFSYAKDAFAPDFNNDSSYVDYPNQIVRFVPPDEGIWCRVSVQFGQAFLAGMSKEPYSRKPGVFTIQCFARMQTGVKTITQFADAAEAHFAYWSSGDLECLEASQVVVGVTDSVGAPEGSGWYQINLNVRFRAG